MTTEHDIQNLNNRVTELEEIVEIQQAKIESLESLQNTVEELHGQIRDVNNVLRNYATATNTSMQKMAEAIRGDVDIESTGLKTISTRKPVIKSISFNNVKVDYG